MFISNKNLSSALQNEPRQELVCTPISYRDGNLWKLNHSVGKKYIFFYVQNAMELFLLWRTYHQLQRAKDKQVESFDKVVSI